MSFISIHAVVGRYMYVATKRERERERERENLERVCVRYTDQFMLHSACERTKKRKGNSRDDHTHSARERAKKKGKETHAMLTSV